MDKKYITLEIEITEKVLKENIRLDVDSRMILQGRLIRLQKKLADLTRKEVANE